MKYFEEDDIPVSFQEAKIKKKFAMICDVVSALFVDYNNRPSQRNYLVGYIAMVHKDMGLTLEDMEVNYNSSCINSCESVLQFNKLYYVSFTELYVRLYQNLNCRIAEHNDRGVHYSTDKIF